MIQLVWNIPCKCQRERGEKDRNGPFYCKMYSGANSHLFNFHVAGSFLSEIKETNNNNKENKEDEEDENDMSGAYPGRSCFDNYPIFARILIGIKKK